MNILNFIENFRQTVEVVWYFERANTKSFTLDSIRSSTFSSKDDIPYFLLKKKLVSWTVFNDTIIIQYED